MKISIGNLIENNSVDDNYSPYPNIDIKYGPWTTIEEFLLAVPMQMRAVGLTAGIITSEGIVEYWFKQNINDDGLILKTADVAEGVDGKTPILEMGAITYVEYEESSTANLTRVGEDEQLNPIYRLSLTIPKGKTGYTPKLQGGIVTTLSPNTSATAIITQTGTDDNGNPIYTINLGIPSGTDGESGKTASFETGTTTTLPFDSAASLEVVFNGVDINNNPKYLINAGIPKGRDGATDTLTFTGAVDATYDGTSPITINVPDAITSYVDL